MTTGKYNTTVEYVELTQLISDYATSVVDGMDLDTLVQFAYERIVENLETMTEAEVLENIQEFAPHLLDS